WGAHAATATPLSPWAANVFWPLPHSYAFGDSLYGYSPVGVLFGSGPTASLVRYSVVFVLAYALAAAGAYLLARQLGCRPLAASVAAAAYAFAPWHLSQDGHLNVLSNGGIPLCLALLARGHGVGGRGAQGPVRPACILAGWAVAAWQLTLGFAVGLQFVYLLGALGLGALALVVTGRWRPAPGRGRAVLAANLAGLALFATIGLALATTYYGVAEAHPQAERTVADLKFFSPPLSGFLVPPATSTLWEGTYRTARSRLVWPTEQALGVGAVLVVLAGYGLLRGDWSRRRRVGLAVAAAGLLLLGAGTTVAGAGGRRRPRARPALRRQGRHAGHVGVDRRLPPHRQRGHRVHPGPAGGGAAAHGRLPRSDVGRLPAPARCAQCRAPAGAGRGHAVGRRRGPLGEWPRRDGPPR